MAKWYKKIQRGTLELALVLFYFEKAGILFLHGIYKRVCLYSSICAARSSLSSVVSISRYERLSGNPKVSRFVEDIFNINLTLPK